MNNRGRDDNDRVEELSFEDNSPPPRAGDLRVEPGRRDAEISPQRVRNAGKTSGEIEQNDVTDEFYTADDLSPATLFDEAAIDDDKLVAADKELSIVDRRSIGGGYGLDEAELARATGRPE